MQRWLKGLIAGSVTAAVGVLLGLTPIGASFEQSVGLSWLFKLRGPIQAPEGVVVVAIDDQTGSHLGVSKLPREWPRSVHGRLIENLTRLGASAIVFDIDFQQPKRAEDDAAFGKAVADSGRVILVEKLVGKRQPLVNSSGKQAGSVWVEQLALPIPVLATTAKGLGPFPLPKVQVAVHQFWAFKQSVGAPTMPAMALQVHLIPVYPHLARLLKKTGVLGPPLPADTARAPEMLAFMRKLRAVFNKTPELGKTLRDMLANENGLDIPPLDRPLVQALVGLYEGDDQRYLNFYGPPGSITTIPYHLAAGNQKADSGIKLPELTGKVVFVGFSDLYDPGQPDRFYTVFTNDDGVDLSGVEIAATSYRQSSVRQESTFPRHNRRNPDRGGLRCNRRHHRLPAAGYCWSAIGFDSGGRLRYGRPAGFHRSRCLAAARDSDAGATSPGAIWRPRYPVLFRKGKKNTGDTSHRSLFARAPG